VITLRRTACFGTCPVYSLEIYEDGTVKYLGTDFVQIKGEQRATIPKEAVRALISDFLRIRYFKLQNSYETYKDPKGQVWHITDLSTVYTSLRVGKRKKEVKDYAWAPKELTQLEFEVDRVANTHRWIHGDKDDLKQWEFVASDVYRRTKPGMTPFMQAAGLGDLQALQREHDAGPDINAVDETGWTPLMFASASCQEQAVSRLLAWGAKVDLRDKNGDTALIGASAAFCAGDARERQAAILLLLLSHGADPNLQNAVGETALMAVTTYGNNDAARALLDSGARPELQDSQGRTALEYARSAVRKYNDRFWTAGLWEIVKTLEARK